MDIILTNNGYRCINLGIKQPLSNILGAAEEHKADAIGLSGLLVKSTVIMRENLEEMTAQQLKTPVILGGAALTRSYVEHDCVKAYSNGQVAYARDAFDGLHLMDLITKGTLTNHLASRKPAPRRKQRTLEHLNGNTFLRPVDIKETRVRRTELQKGVELPSPPFFGARMIDHVDVKALLPYLNDNMLYQFHWGYKKNGRQLNDFLAWAKKELRPILSDLIDQAEDEDVFNPQSVYGYYRAAGEGNDLILFDEDGESELCRFTLPRQNKDGGICIADFVRDIDADCRDVVGLQVVTVGQRASEVARQWFAKDRYQDYVRLPWLGCRTCRSDGRIRSCPHSSRARFRQSRCP